MMFNGFAVCPFQATCFGINDDVVKPLWGFVDAGFRNPGCAARPWAMMFNSFAVCPFRATGFGINDDVVKPLWGFC